jgi:putative acetyltransferase
MTIKILIRPELPKDYAAVEAIHVAAFRTDAESKVVNAIRENGNATISLLPLWMKTWSVIFFSALSTLTHLLPKRDLGLRPLAVLPTLHKQGIGSQLIRAGLEQCRELGYDYAVVLGGPNYYMRFGFEKASVFGLQNEYGVDDEFMAFKFKALPAGGLVKYTPEFSLFSV